QHARRIRRAHPQKAPRARPRGRARDRPRRRLPPRMSRFSLKRRLVLAATGAVALMLAALTVVFNVVLDQRLSDDARNVVQSRAQAGVAVTVVKEHGISVVEPKNDNPLDERVWIYQGTHPVERAHDRVRSEEHTSELQSRGHLVC